MLEGFTWIPPVDLSVLLSQVAGVLLSPYYLVFIYLVAPIATGVLCALLAYAEYQTAVDLRTNDGRIELPIDIRYMAFGAAFGRRGRVAVVTRKPLSPFRTRLIQLCGVVFTQRLIRFFHAEMDVTELAKYKGKFKVVLVGHFDDQLPFWVEKLKSLSGVMHRTSPFDWFDGHPSAAVPALGSYWDSNEVHG